MKNFYSVALREIALLYFIYSVFMIFIFLFNLNAILIEALIGFILTSLFRYALYIIEVKIDNESKSRD